VACCVQRQVTLSKKVGSASGDRRFLGKTDEADRPIIDRHDPQAFDREGAVIELGQRDQREMMAVWRARS
jgi:hypothetical protein